MSLLDDVSIVVTPNGYKAGELYAVVPVPTEGSEEVTNGDFATDSDWSKATGVTISGGNAIFNNSTANNNGIYQAAVFQTNTQYKITAEVSNYSSGNVTAWSGSSQNSTSNESFTGNGTKTWIISTGASNGYLLLSSATTNGNFNIDNVSVKEYTSADMDVTRATAATRIDEDGLVNYALGVEEVTNGDFSNGSTDWTPFGSTFVVSNANPYNGNDTALFTASGVNGAKVTQSISTVVGNTYHLSCYAQYNSGDQSQIEIEGVLEYPNGIGITNGITTFTYLQTSFTATSTTSVIAVRERGGNNNASCYLYGLSVKEVNNVPRIDYTGGGCPHILAEPQRTNLVTDSESYTGYFNNSGTLIYNNTTSPDGLENGAKNYASTTGAFKGLSKAFGSTLNNSAYTLSIFAKAGEFDNLFFYNIGSPSGNGGVWFNLSTGSVGTTHASWSNAKMEDLGNGWYRCSSTVTLGGTSDNLYILLSDADNSVTATASGTDGYYIYGASLEEGSYPTSYIPTSGSTVTRNQDIFTRDGIGSLINDSEGVLFVEMAALANDGTFKQLTLNDGNTANRILVDFTDTSNQIRVFCASGGVSQVSETFNVTSSLSFNKIAFKYKLNDFALWVNGVEVATDTSGITPIGLNKLSFNNGAGSFPFFGKVKQLQVYTTALTDTQLATLTT